MTPDNERIFHPDDRILLAATAAVLAGALAYAGANAEWLIALTVGGVLMAASVLLARLGRGGALSQFGLPLVGMLMVGLLIHVAHGRQEAHFAVFAMLACTVVYRSVLPVVVGAATIAVHHLSFNFIQQAGWGPICFTAPGLGIVLEHAAYVVVEAVVLALLAVRSRADFATTHTATDLSAVLGRMQQTIGQVRQSAESIGTASSEIASGNMDLSQRTELTASHLQQAASSMAELTGVVRQSAESAQQAQRLSSSAAEVAERGGVAVARVVDTMNEINSSSKRIADIVGVIDGIAFQTNILALNAAVEAARAGEQGRGFAVVASEVRSLAGRSAEAAREIKSLIAASVERVETGTRLVADAGATMQEIVGSVQRVGDIIGEITTASNDQSERIGRVNSAVSQLDQMTQQNAALVEQSAAAAASLKEQAASLSAVVASFQASGGGTGSAPSLAAPSPAPAPKPIAAKAPSPVPSKSATGAGAGTANASPPAPKTAVTAIKTPAAARAAASPATTAPQAPRPKAASKPEPKVSATADADGDWETF